MSKGESMRTIKFRGIPINKKDRDNFGYEVGKPIDKFIYGDLEIDYNYGGGTKYYISMEVFGTFAYRDRIQVIPETVGQFTGLLDKNGKEIYEGDIVKWGHIPYNGGSIIENPIRNAIVRLYPDLNFECINIQDVFTGQRKVFRYGNFIYEETHKYLEVIGNIHD